MSRTAASKRLGSTRMKLAYLVVFHGSEARETVRDSLSRYSKRAIEFAAVEGFGPANASKFAFVAATLDASGLP